MRVGFLLGFVPDDIILLVIMVVIFGYVVGLLPRSFFFGALTLYILIFTSVLESVLGELSPGWLFLIIAAVGASFARGALGLILGQNVADGLLSHLLRDLVVLPFKMFGAMVRMVCAVLSKLLFQRLVQRKEALRLNPSGSVPGLAPQQGLTTLLGESTAQERPQEKAWE